MRHIPNFLKNALGRPQMGHLLYDRTLNFGFIFTFIINDFFAKPPASLVFEWHTHQFQKRLAFFIRVCGCDNGNVQALDF